jgi:hypothetical protein
MLRTFRKYHRTLALIACLPLIVTVISGVGYTIMGEWFHQDEIGEFLLSLHTFEIIHLEKIYPLLNGIGLIGLLVTGITMTGIFKKRPLTPKTGDS